MMKMLYEESPSRFEEFLAMILQPDYSLSVGTKFMQQVKKTQENNEKSSIPDLVIAQQSFELFFEVKTSDWFYGDQIERHSQGFASQAEHKILFLLSNFEQSERGTREKEFRTRFQSYRKSAEEQGIKILTLSFEELLTALEKACVSEPLRRYLEEFEQFLDRNSLLPTWKYLLDVVNCAGSMQQIEQGFYACPNTGGSYRHKRAKYFGAYANKNVSKIFEIKAVVIISPNSDEDLLVWCNDDTTKEDVIINDARKKLDSTTLQESYQVFLLENGRDIEFKKDSKGGLFGSKIYFNDIAKDCKDITELAKKLNGKVWSNFK
jgi:hypothetical protein